MTGPVPRRYRAGYCWLMLLLGWAALVLSAADRALWATTAPVAAADIGLTPTAALGAFVTATQAGYLFALLFGSAATDWLGPRAVLAATLVCLGCGAFAFSGIGSLGDGLGIQFCIGVGAAPVFAVGMKLITGWFDEQKRATAIGLFMTALSVPTILVNLLAPIGIAAFGWRANYQFVGVTTVALGLVCALLVRNGDGALESFTRAPLWPLVRKLIGSRDYRWLVLANMAAPWAAWGFMIWANLLLVEHYHIPLAASGKIVASYGFGAFAGLLLLAPICDALRLDRRRSAIGCLLTFSAALLLVGATRDLTLLRLLVPLLGLIAYVYGPLVNTMLAGASGPIAATGLGMATLVTFAAEGVQPLIVGTVYSGTKSFFLVCATLSVGPLIAAFAVQRVASPAQR